MEGYRKLVYLGVLAKLGLKEVTACPPWCRMHDSPSSAHHQAARALAIAALAAQLAFEDR
jgi:hypothetical protein